MGMNLGRRGYWLAWLDRFRALSSRSGRGAFSSLERLTRRALMLLNGQFDRGGAIQGLPLFPLRFLGDSLGERFIRVAQPRELN